MWRTLIALTVLGVFNPMIGIGIITYLVWREVICGLKSTDLKS